MTDDSNSYLPLSPATLHVLLALTGGDLHGYGILLEVVRQSEGQYKMGPGTLYDNLRKLKRLGWVDEEQANPADAGSRRTYHLSESGCGVLRAEIDRLGAVLREARRCLRVNEGRQV